VFGEKVFHLNWCKEESLVGFDRYGHTDTDTDTDMVIPIYSKPIPIPILPSKIYIKPIPIPISVLKFISNRYRYR
jgi:hypothetical protein